MKSLTKVTAFYLFTILSVRAVAMPMDYTFDVEFEFGPLSGQVAPVCVTLDGITGTRVEVFSPLSGLLAFDFTFGDSAFSITDDSRYPGGGPELATVNGQLFFARYVTSRD